MNDLIVNGVKGPILQASKADSDLYSPTQTVGNVGHCVILTEKKQCKRKAMNFLRH